MTSAILRLDDVCAGYGAADVLKSVSLEVAAGKINAVLGANGAGKSTLLRSISGLTKPRSGRVVLDGSEVTGRPPEQLVRRGLVHVPEGRGIINELTVAENLQLAGLWRKDRAKTLRETEEAFERFPSLARRRSQLGSQLSGGERQMLAISRAVIARPKVLLLDEPSLGLAPLIVKDIMALLRELATSDGLGVLLVEQNARSALSVADHADVLSLGSVALSGEPRTLQQDPAFHDAYLGI
jgi:branched-chain amino acid transport system ATP-binding protein